MKSLLALSLATIMSTASAAEIPAGTHVLLRLEHPVSARTANVGDGVHLRTAVPLGVDGKILIPVGAWVSGTVQRAKRHGRLRGRAELQIGIDRLMLPTGTAVRISPPIVATIQTSTSRGYGGHPALTVGAGMLAGYGGAAIATIWSHDEETAVAAGFGVGIAVGVATEILTRNRDWEIHAGTTVDIVFDHPVEVD